MSSLLTKIGQLAIFLLCAQTLVHFRPKDSYEKYIKLLVSMMLLILMVEPIMDLIGKGEKGDFWESIERYEEKFQEILETPELEVTDIEVMIQEIARQKVEEGVAYAQKQEAGPSGNDAEECIKEQEGSVSFAEGSTQEYLEQQETEVTEIAVQVEVEEIETIAIGVEHGKTACSD